MSFLGAIWSGPLASFMYELLRMNNYDSFFWRAEKDTWGNKISAAQVVQLNRHQSLREKQTVTPKHGWFFNIIPWYRLSTGAAWAWDMFLNVAFILLVGSSRVFRGGRKPYLESHCYLASQLSRV